MMRAFMCAGSGTRFFSLWRVSAIFVLLLALWGSSGAAFADPVITVGPNLGQWTIGEVQMALTASGGAGAYTGNLVSGNLPTGLALRTDVPSFFPVGSTAGLIGVATTPGTYNFTISVTSGGITVNQACTMKIIAMTLKDLYNLPDAFVGNSYSYTLTPLNTGGHAITWTPPASGMPPGMSF